MEGRYQVEMLPLPGDMLWDSDVSFLFPHLVLRETDRYREGERGRKIEGHTQRWRDRERECQAMRQTEGERERQRPSIWRGVL